MPIDRRPDLAAMVVPLGRALVNAELPVLRANDLSMWAYGVLLGLDEDVRTQAALAQAIGADKTRIIGVLDELQERGLIDRQPDPDDRRARLLSLTLEGRLLRELVQHQIRRNEERILDHLTAADRRAFLRALRTLSELPPEQLLPPT
jgi:DNA-binding MarR family transcriptional regulator